MLNNATLATLPNATAWYADLTWQAEFKVWADAHGVYGRMITDAIDEAIMYAGEYDNLIQTAINFCERELNELQFEAAMEQNAIANGWGRD